jgi:hypothetical protein
VGRKDEGRCEGKSKIEGEKEEGREVTKRN